MPEEWCVDVQYSSKKLGGKFLSVGFEQQVKNGREYKIWIREVDLITCKSYEEVDANLSIGFADVFAEDCAEDNKVSTSVKPPVKETKETFHSFVLQDVLAVVFFSCC
uniref:Uncharacterized protein n=1 Tax=Ditylenchus dipsaci TaxID=166011 RepID=A0A915CVB4_9BILA